MASFVTTWMDSEAKALIAETQDVNMVDTSQYPQCTEMEQRYACLICALSHSTSKVQMVLMTTT